MNTADYQRLVARLLSKPVAATGSKGLTRWMDLGASSPMPKERPWTRGGRPFVAGAQVPWFPRTTRPQTTDACYAVHSPVGQLPSFTKQGWFMANLYVRSAPDAAGYGDDAGVLPAMVIDAIEAKIARLYRH
jgi:hypothetical protein